MQRAKRLIERAETPISDAARGPYPCSSRQPPIAMARAYSPRLRGKQEIFRFTGNKSHLPPRSLCHESNPALMNLNHIARRDAGCRHPTANDTLVPPG